MEICWNIEKSPGNFRIFIAILAVTEFILKQKCKLEQELPFDWYVICLISWLPSMKKTPHSNTVSPYRLASFAFAQCKLIFAVIEIVLNLFTIEFFDYFFFSTVKWITGNWKNANPMALNVRPVIKCGSWKIFDKAVWQMIRLHGAEFQLKIRAILCVVEPIIHPRYIKYSNN